MTKKEKENIKKWRLHFAYVLIYYRNENYKTKLVEEYLLKVLLSAPTSIRIPQVALKSLQRTMLRLCGLSNGDEKTSSMQ